MRCSPRRQSGAALLLAVFLITGLALLGMLMARTLVVTSETTLHEWQAAQALYAAEAGVEYAAHRIVRGDPSPIEVAPAAALTLEPNRAWFHVTAREMDDGTGLWTIESTGLAGGSVEQPMAQRRVRVLFKQ